jgi:hypothetical protein
MKRAVLLLAVLAMTGLLGAAVAWDSVRMASDARHRVDLADQEMQKHELRLVKLLAGFVQRSPEVQAAIAAYQRAGSPPERHEAYEQLVTSFQESKSSEIDPTHPLDRKFMDDIAGAINRREIAQQQYEDEVDAYQRFLSGLRGGVARWLSAHTREDWKPDG